MTVLSSQIIDKARLYGVRCHQSTFHSYDGWPYAYHLESVYNIAQRHINLIPIEHQENVLASCWTHDVIEDCRQTYNDVVRETNLEIADITYALTNEKGKNRKEREGDKYYSELIKIPFAPFVKICDRLANVGYGKHVGKEGRMFQMYKKEHPYFMSWLTKVIEYDSMLIELDNQFNP